MHQSSRTSEVFSFLSRYLVLNAVSPHFLSCYRWGLVLRRVTLCIVLEVFISRLQFAFTMASKTPMQLLTFQSKILEPSGSSLGFRVVELLNSSLTAFVIELCTLPLLFSSS